MFHTSGAFMPVVPVGSLSFALAHSTYLPLSCLPSVQNKPMSPRTYVTLPPKGQEHRKGLGQEQVWCTKIFLSKNSSQTLNGQYKQQQ